MNAAIITTELERLMRKAGGHAHGIESTVVGLPDMNWCIDGKEHWIEIKWGPDTLSPAQIHWARQRSACGGRVWLARVSHPTYGTYRCLLYYISKFILTLPLEVRSKDIYARQPEFETTGEMNDCFQRTLDFIRQQL